MSVLPAGGFLKSGSFGSPRCHYYLAHPLRIAYFALENDPLSPAVMKVKEIPISLFQSLRLRLGPNRSSDSSPRVPVVVSLTTIKPRLSSVDLVIRSIKKQSATPKKILLWVHESLMVDLPSRLTQLQDDLFEIRPTHLHCSHKKLIHTLAAYPEEKIVTCDDDLMYRPQWLNRLHEESLRFPNDIIANQTRTVQTDANGNFLSYENWPVDEPERTHGPRILPIGAEGVLYPPSCLDTRYSEEAVFLELSPKADDLWFKAMSLLKGTQCRRATNSGKKAIPIMGSQKFSLKHENIKKDLNSVQWQRLVTHFSLKEKFQIK